LGRNTDAVLLRKPLPGVGPRGATEGTQMMRIREPMMSHAKLAMAILFRCFIGKREKMAPKQITAMAMPNWPSCDAAGLVLAVSKP